MPTKTAKTYLSDKAALRAEHLPAGKELYVLDCYAGKGLIWAAVKELSGRKIVTLPIDTSKDVGFRLPGDNRAYLDSIDLDQFDVVDLDAYGVPYQQLKILFERHYKGAVFVTFIQTMYGIMPNGLLEDVGFTKEMVKECPALFTEKGWEYFLEWLALHGVKSVCHRSHSRKHYLYFSTAASVPKQRKASVAPKPARHHIAVEEDQTPAQEPAQAEASIQLPAWRGSKRAG